MQLQKQSGVWRHVDNSFKILNVQSLRITANFEDRSASALSCCKLGDSVAIPLLWDGSDSTGSFRLIPLVDSVGVSCIRCSSSSELLS